MSFILEGVKGLCNNSVNLLCQLPVKEGVKQGVSAVAFVAGIAASYNLSSVALGKRKITTENGPDAPLGNKVAMGCAKISLILVGAVSRPGVYIISSLAGRVFPANSFGPNTIYAENPRHPRHIASFAALAFALPAVLQLTHQGACFMYKKITSEGQEGQEVKEAPKAKKSQEDVMSLSDYKARLLVLFTAVTSRPVLHVGNQLAHRCFNALFAARG